MGSLFNPLFSRQFCRPAAKPRGPAENPSFCENWEEVRDALPEGRSRSLSTSRTYGYEDRASFAICSQGGVSGRASRPAHWPTTLSEISRYASRLRGCFYVHPGFGYPAPMITTRLCSLDKTRTLPLVNPASSGFVVFKRGTNKVTYRMGDELAFIDGL